MDDRKIKKLDKTVKLHKNKSRKPSSRIPGFYRLSVEQRLSHLIQDYGITTDEAELLRDGKALKAEHAVNILENAIGVFEMPLGLAPNFLINEKDYLIPMATEEPSVIAAASNAARLVRDGGGFTAESSKSVMIGQIQLVDIENLDKAVDALKKNEKIILAKLDEALPRMKKRGGGAVGMEVRPVEDSKTGDKMLIVHLLIDVVEAMGANIVNTVCELAAPQLESLTGGRANMKVVSNLADRRLARAEFKLPLNLLKEAGQSGREIAERLVQASRWAELDPYRAATHNKGIFNGITAVAVALGQDWRAIEAGGHAYAVRDGQYRGLTSYKIEGDYLVGKIELPMQVGWVGGTSCMRPDVQILRRVINVESAEEFANVLASVGLAQNFAACLALVTEGIQQGHMALHARSVAASAGIPSQAVEKVAEEMVRENQIRVDAAEKVYLRLKRSQAEPEFPEMETFEAFAPGKVILFGEHAVVYGYPAIVTVLNHGMRVTIRKDKNGPRVVHPQFNHTFTPLSTDNDFHQFSLAANIALKEYDLQQAPIEIMVESDLVPGVGLGSSASFSVALCKAFANLTGSNGNGQGNQAILKTINRMETVFHYNPSGADASAILAEQAIWFQNSAPILVTPISSEKSFSGLVCVVDKAARTSDMVNQVATMRQNRSRFVNGIFEEIGDITVEAILALENGDTHKLGRLMQNNHELLARLNLSTDKLDQAVDYVLDLGAAGAKLTGAGGGGAMVVLLPDDDSAPDIADEIRGNFKICYSFNINPR